MRRKKLTKKEALEIFHQTYPRDSFIGIDGTLDRVKRCEAWNNFTDALCKNGQITQEQYSSWTNPF